MVVTFLRKKRRQEDGGLSREGGGGLFLVAGLGNPGEKYARTRHNAGFMVAAELMRRHGMGRTRRRYGGRWCEAELLGRSVAVFLPQTFMNRSGEAVAEAVRKKHISPDRVIVVHDDMDFPIGVVRCRTGGGTGGHNGLASITGRLGTDQYVRVRVGVGRPRSGEDPRDWVLSPFDEPEEERARAIGTAADCVEAIITGGIETAMGRFNRRDES